MVAYPQIVHRRGIITRIIITWDWATYEVRDPEWDRMYFFRGDPYHLAFKVLDGIEYDMCFGYQHVINVKRIVLKSE